MNKIIRIGLLLIILLSVNSAFAQGDNSGGAVYYVKALNSREILGGIKKHQVTIFVSVPLLYEKLYHGILNGSGCS